jgi:mannose-6-phosphate isomerase-like protein (cupin superfamily)
MADFLFSLADVTGQLPTDPTVEPFRYAFRHGSMKLGLYAPQSVDSQHPHKQDELYIIASGTGVFVKNGERRWVKTHDVLFVEAGAEHRFEEFTEDFSTWVIFWGPEGGEGPEVIVPDE